MIVIDNKKELQDTIQTLKQSGNIIGLVPTMGALHEGHLSLMRIATEKADKVVASIYVNPSQFAPGEDFDAYPRTFEEDKAKLEAENVDLLYLPHQDELYPDGVKIDMDAGEAGKGLDSNFRPHFFHGVATVVRRLFDHVQPDLAVFGEKDYQQLMVIREMVETLQLPIEIIGGPTARDEHGLALASRNAYLEPHEIPIARRLNKILRETAAELKPHEHPDESQDPEVKSTGSRIKSGMLLKGQEKLLKAGFDKIDYIETRWNRILAAGWVGKTRLIDNIAQ